MPSIAKVIRSLALLHALSIASSSSTAGHAKQNLRRRAGSSLLCLILEVHTQASTGEEHHLECDLISEDEGIMVNALQINLPEQLVEEHRKELRRGEWYVRISGATLEETVIEEYGPLRTGISVPQNADIITIPPEEGDLYMEAVQGTRTSRSLHQDQRRTAKSVRRILVVRVSVSDRAPTYSKDQLQQYFFSLQSYSVVRQYALCSSGWLWFKGYQAPYASVVELYVPGNAASFDQRTLLVAALTKLQTQLNVQSITSVAEHIAFIFPPGLQGPMWYGFGTISAYRTVFNDIYGGIPNTVMHELGHNLGLLHAGVGTNQYLDTTDIMGYGDFQQFGPSRCFNGLHLWELGWFTDRTITVDPFKHAVIMIAGVADYPKTQYGHYVVVKVGPYYLSFNRATGVNSGTEAVPNQVTIVQPGSVYSQRVGSISNTTSPFQVGNYGGSSGFLIIKVCKFTWRNTIQLAVVSIGVNNANCS